MLESTAAIVLAGGYSTRFGEQDKALATIDGEPLLSRVVSRGSAVADPVVVSCRADQRSTFADVLADHPSVTFATDPEPDQGPLAGIETSLASIDTRYVIVLACDMPHVDPALLRYLHERCRDHDAAVPESADGWLQPAQAVYRTAPLRKAVQRARTRGDPRLRAPIQFLDAVVVRQDEWPPAVDGRTLTDVNTGDSLTAGSDERDDE